MTKMKNQQNEDEKRQVSVTLVAHGKEQICLLLEAKLKYILGKDAKILVGYRKFSNSGPNVYYANIEVKDLSLTTIQQLRQDWTFFMPTFKTFTVQGGAIHFTLKAIGLPNV